MKRILTYWEQNFMLIFILRKQTREITSEFVMEKNKILENPWKCYVSNQRRYKFSELFVAIRKLIVLSKQKMGTFQLIQISLSLHADWKERTRQQNLPFAQLKFAKWRSDPPLWNAVRGFITFITKYKIYLFYIIILSFDIIILSFKEIRFSI